MLVLARYARFTASPAPGEIRKPMRGGGCIVRRAQLRDSEVLARMLGFARRDDGIAQWEFEIEHLRSHAFTAPAKFDSWIALVDGLPVGCAAAHRGFDMRLAQPTLVLSALFVEIDFRGSGVARGLLSAVAARALEIGAREVTITAGLGNAAAQRFLISMGAAEQQTAAYQLGFDHLEWLAKESQ